ncbi:rhodanese-like domain-containing protein [Streptomyces sp. ODS28]|uniref:rhodanese-like domain-containing protein n=1 Tax=Streptomyces sp. ODS28 TaxID=3136688 RepID=UPI0031E95F32
MSCLARLIPRRVLPRSLRGDPGPRRNPARLTPAEAHRRAEDGRCVLLDVREASEWGAGHAPGAHHLPLSRLLEGAALPPAAEGRPVVAVCRSGQRSQRAARLLAERGVEARDMSGGMLAWAEEGLPVAGGNPGDGAGGGATP